jgi:hypothetical protein
MQSNSAVGIFEAHTLAEEAISELKHSGMDIKKLSIVGRDQHTDEHVVGYYNAGDRMMHWGKLGAFWGGLWGMLFDAGVFIIPGIGPLLVAGPLVATIAGGIQGAAVTGGLSALGAALFSIGIPRDSILQYESAIKGGHFVLVYHGTAAETEKARSILEGAKAAQTAVHYSEPAVIYSF